MQGKEKDQNLAELATELDSTRDKLAEVVIIIIIIMIFMTMMIFMMMVFKMMMVKMTK